MKKWIYNNPVFECDEFNYELLRYSPWSGHRNFIYDFMNFFKPGVVVELGSHYGCSSFAIAQAIKDLNIHSVLYSVDTWQGDDFTGNNYSNDVYDSFNEIRSKCYSEDYVKMMRMTFDEASIKFEKNSIDVIHIDGSHHYDDVKHDFELWKDKVAEDGIILLHDISDDKVLGSVMGSYIFWNELKRQYKWTAQLNFSFGLGIIFLSEDKYNKFKNNIDFRHYQKINNSLAVEYKDELRKNYFEIQDNKFHISSLYEQIETKDKHLLSYANDMDEKNKYILQLQDEKSEIEKIIKSYENNMIGKESYIKELEQNKEEADKTIKLYEENVSGKDSYIKELEQNKEEADKTIKLYEENVSGKDSYIKELEQNKAEADKTIKSYEENVSEKDSYIKELEQNKAEVDKTIKSYEENVSGKDSYIKELEQNKAEADKTIKSYEENVSGKDSYIKELEQNKAETFNLIKQYEEVANKKDNYIIELENKIEKINEELHKTLDYKIKHLFKK